MTRLQSELLRLYIPRAVADSAEPRLIDGQGHVRAMVLELAKPADWESLAKVWRGVQADLNLPAPAIAVSGVDGYQLWFSLAEPRPLEQATAFLAALRTHYLPDVSPERIGWMPATDQRTVLVPPRQTSVDHWSAFVAPDLAPVFAETPWLDIPPSLDGQADLLSQLASIPLADFQAALDRLTMQPAHQEPPQTATGSPSIGAHGDPKRFLLDVMANEAVVLSLRIEAAKALLPYFDPKP